MQTSDRANTYLIHGQLVWKMEPWDIAARIIKGHPKEDWELAVMKLTHSHIFVRNWLKAYSNNELDTRQLLHKLGKRF